VRGKTAGQPLSKMEVWFQGPMMIRTSLPSPRDSRAAIADLARQGRDIARRHPWLPAVMHRPPPMGPSTLRYIDYFLGLLAGTGLGTAAKMEIIAIINGFALMYGAMQAALDDERACTGMTEQ
jgi:hypothetical protein